ncbi:hypothetical protein BDP55DRAFT_761870 [Colletotrichum godetiae]|uniref:Uncharacterized protein n=1 Tax=Colletotrichum godetiae TaxID=1209918 RepID=A0AAJ0A6D6_9PEZI|nr:uncharacterized protein BDP55DRAFT_761870 [Colletotrichum godetiae]KAK1657351.1 hypothetical protein BDP55DRAFT_761870 [Colletotrichum godetiae]
MESRHAARLMARLRPLRTEEDVCVVGNNGDLELNMTNEGLARLLTGSDWYLASVMLPSRKHNLSFETGTSHEEFDAAHLVHINGRIAVIDAIDRKEVEFKLNTETINSLVDYDTQQKADTSDHNCRSAFVKTLRARFGEFVYRTNLAVLEGMESDGSGELNAEQSIKVRNSIRRLLGLPIIPTPEPSLLQCRKATLITHGAHVPIRLEGLAMIVPGSTVISFQPSLATPLIASWETW